MQRLHRQQTEDTENTINQSSGGFSLINIQWASFATGATAIIVCALLFFAVIVCCWFRTKNIRRSKRSHSQLLDVLRRRTDSVPCLSRICQALCSLFGPRQMAVHPQWVDLRSRSLPSPGLLSVRASTVSLPSVPTSCLPWWTPHLQPMWVSWLRQRLPWSFRASPLPFPGPIGIQGTEIHRA